MHLEHYEYNVTPFRLPNAPRTFQRRVNRVFSSQIGKGLQLFLDVAIREIEHLVIYSRQVGEGAEFGQVMEAQTSREGEEGLDVIVDDDFDKEKE